jgi:indolepyruvate ferredoxin oxidoreductase beta subunit
MAVARRRHPDYSGRRRPARALNKKTLNVALLGLLSNFVEIPEEHWLEAIRAHVPPRFLDANLAAFALGRRATLTELTK